MKHHLLLVPFLALAAVPALAIQGTPLPVLNNSTPGSNKLMGDQSLYSVSEIKDPTVQGGKALRVKLTTPAPKPWSAMLYNYITKKVEPEHKLEATVWLKAVNPDAAQPAKATIVIQESKASPKQLVRREVTLTDQWAPYTIAAATGGTIAPHATTVAVMLGYGQQVVDVGPITVTKQPLTP